MAAELSSEAGAPAPADPVVAPAVAEREENTTEEVAVDRKETEPDEAAADDRKEAKAEQEVIDERKDAKAEQEVFDERKDAKAEQETADDGMEMKPEDDPAPTDPVEATVAAEIDEKKAEEVSDDGKEITREEEATDDGKEIKREKEATNDGKESESDKNAADDEKERKLATDEEKETKAEREAAGDGKGTKPEKEATDDENETKPEKTTKDGKKTKPEEEAAPSIEKSSSFREESNLMSDLKESEKKALVELRAKVEEAILENKLLKNQEEPNPKEKKEAIDEQKRDEAARGKEKETPSEKSVHPASSVDKGEEKPYPDAQENEKGDEKAKLEQSAEAKAEPAIPDNEPAAANDKESTSDKEKAAPLEEKAVEACDREISLWGVPLLPSKGAEGTNVILLKFLRARDFKVKDAFELLQSVLQWRKEYKADTILEDESLGADLTGACYMEGFSRMGHPLCYSMSGVFDNDELYRKTFGTEEAREKFTRWTVKLMEKAVQKLEFRPGSAASLMQITDLKNSPGPSKKELRNSLKQVVELLQDNYPEFVARNIFINVPFWYYAFNAIISPFLTQRTKSKFVFARPSNVSETLLKYIPPEAIPVRYGGLKRDNDTEFSDEDGKASELIAKSSSTTTIEIPTPEAGTTFVWDLNVLGWDVNYKEEFVPTDEGSYTVLVRKNKKMGAQEGPLRNSFRNSEPGKITLTVENNTYWKKKVLYRYKMKSSAQDE